MESNEIVEGPCDPAGQRACPVRVGLQRGAEILEAGLELLAHAACMALDGAMIHHVKQLLALVPPVHTVQVL